MLGRPQTIIPTGFSTFQSPYALSGRREGGEMVQDMVRKGLQSAVNTYSIQRMAEKYWMLYKSVLKRQNLGIEPALGS